MIHPELTPSFQLVALHFIINWNSDQNNFIAAVKVAMVATMVIGTSIKVAKTKITICLLGLISKWGSKVDSTISVNFSLFS
jgi:hypothetical protein